MGKVIKGSLGFQGGHVKKMCSMYNDLLLSCLLNNVEFKLKLRLDRLYGRYLICISTEWEESIYFEQEYF